jgi:hypothetical protein
MATIFNLLYTTHLIWSSSIPALQMKLGKGKVK